MIQHIVLFTPKAELTDEVRQDFASSVTSTLSQSPHLLRYTVGRHIDIRPGYERNMGDKTYQYAAVLEFADRESLVAYLNTTAHATLGEAFWRHCERCVICEVEVLDDPGLLIGRTTNE